MHDVGSPACGYEPASQQIHAPADAFGSSRPDHPERLIPLSRDARGGVCFRLDGPRDVDDALDAAGAPHHDERGTLSTAQRVAWLAARRRADVDRFHEANRSLATALDEARARLAATEKHVGDMLELAKKPLHDDLAAARKELERERICHAACGTIAHARAPQEIHADYQSDAVKACNGMAASLQAAVGERDQVMRETGQSVKRTGYDRERLADQVRGIAAGLTYNDSQPEGAAKALLYELSSHIRSGSTRHPVSEATKPLQQRIEQLDTELKAANLTVENARAALADAGVTGFETLASGVRALAEQRNAVSEAKALRDEGLERELDRWVPKQVPAVTGDATADRIREVGSRMQEACSSAHGAHEKLNALGIAQGKLPLRVLALAARIADVAARTKNRKPAKGHATGRARKPRVAAKRRATSRKTRVGSGERS